MATHFRKLAFDPLQVSPDGHAYVLHARDGLTTLRLEASQVQWQGPHLLGSLTLWCDGESVISQRLFNFTALDQRGLIVNLVGRDLWSPALNRLCTDILAAQGRRLYAPRLVEFQRNETLDLPWPLGVLPPVRIDTPCIYFGDGGTGKSFLGLYAAGQLALQGFTTLFLDYEMTAERHRNRLHQLFGDDEPEGIRYLQADMPLVELARDLAVLIQAHRIDYLVVDSIAHACHGDVERNEIATGYMAVAQSLGIGSLHIAHVTKRGAHADERPFGSIFWHNSARETWSIARAPEYDRDDAVGLVMQQRKSNIGAPNTKLYTLQLVSENHRIFVQAVEAEAGQLFTAREQLRGALADGPLTRDELRARCTSLTDAAFRKALQREREAGAVIDLADGLLALNQAPSA